MIESLTNPLLQYGVPGIMLLWFMFVNHKDMEKMHTVIENNTKALISLKSRR